MDGTCFAADFGSGFALSFFKALLTYAKVDDNMGNRHSFRQVGKDF
jgi:hypothetical protein